MSDETTEGTAARPVLRTLADKVNWLIDQTHPAGRGPCTNAEVAACEHDHGGAVPPRPDRKILSADSHVASLDIDVAYALSKLSTTEYRVDLDGAITILTVYEYNSGFKFGYPGIIRDKRGIPVPKEARQAIRSNDGSPHGPIVRISMDVSQWTWIRLLHPLGIVLARMALGADSLILGTDKLYFNAKPPGASAFQERRALKKRPDGPTAGIVRGVKFCCGPVCRQRDDRLGCWLPG